MDSNNTFLTEVTRGVVMVHTNRTPFGYAHVAVYGMLGYSYDPLWFDIKYSLSISCETSDFLFIF